MTVSEEIEKFLKLEGFTREVGVVFLLDLADEDKNKVETALQSMVKNFNFDKPLLRVDFEIKYIEEGPATVPETLEKELVVVFIKSGDGRDSEALNGFFKKNTCPQLIFGFGHKDVFSGLFKNEVQVKIAGSVFDGFERIIENDLKNILNT